MAQTARLACHVHAQYNLGFYLQYLYKWPEYFSVAEAANGTLMGYSAAARPPLARPARLSEGCLTGLCAGLRRRRADATVMGKAEGQHKEWHGHVTAVTVAPEYRRLGLAEYFMRDLEEVSEKMYVSHVTRLRAEARGARRVC